MNSQTDDDDCLEYEPFYEWHYFAIYGPDVVVRLRNAEKATPDELYGGLQEVLKHLNARRAFSKAQRDFHDIRSLLHQLTKEIRNEKRKALNSDDRTT